ncbi:MAG: alpha-amylase family glycosyl hydrolase [Promethearchaeota archaeon]
MLLIPEKSKRYLNKKLLKLYGKKARETYDSLVKILEKYSEEDSMIKGIMKSTTAKIKFTENDILLNIYANSIQGTQGSPFQALYRFSEKFLSGHINGIHVLPFYCWDTDHGFSVLNYYEVDSRNGYWEDFTSLSEIFEKIMVDCVINHGSIDNPIIQKALSGDQEFTDFVIVFDDHTKPSQENLLKITRARPSPVLTRYYLMTDRDNRTWATFNKPIKKGSLVLHSGWVWTTFSRPNHPDGTIATRQIDFNFANPKVFLEFVKIILFYVSKGARWIRLDAIGYLWKKIGTSCLHLPETHMLIQIFTEIFKILDHLQVVLIAEVNEPQEKALQYLGTEDTAEADMIYLFTHYPLAIHAVLTGSAEYYMNWIPSLANARGRLFISVLGTHDGMGMKPIGKWLPETEKKRLQRILVEKHGALPNYAILPGGEKIIYELCATPWNFVNEINTDDPLSIQIDRYLAVFALGLSLKGVPSIYINGLLGIQNYEGKLDENRTINREIFDENELNERLSDRNSRMYQIFSRIINLIKIRGDEQAFDPKGETRVFPLNKAVVSVLLSSFSGDEKIFILINVSGEAQPVSINIDRLEIKPATAIKDIITKLSYEINQQTRSLEINMKPYQICWLKINQ